MGKQVPLQLLLCAGPTQGRGSGSVLEWLVQRGGVRTTDPTPQVHTQALPQMLRGLSLFLCLKNKKKGPIVMLWGAVEANLS